MQTAGRWRSPTMPGYSARGQLAVRGAVARIRYGRCAEPRQDISSWWRFGSHWGSGSRWPSAPARPPQGWSASTFHPFGKSALWDRKATALIKEGMGASRPSLVDPSGFGNRSSPRGFSSDGCARQIQELSFEVSLEADRACWWGAEKHRQRGTARSARRELAQAGPISFRDRPDGAVAQPERVLPTRRSFMVLGFVRATTGKRAGPLLLPSRSGTVLDFR